MNDLAQFVPDTYVLLVRGGKVIGTGVMPRWKADKLAANGDGWCIVDRVEWEQVKAEIEERLK